MKRGYLGWLLAMVSGGIGMQAWAEPGDTDLIWGGRNGYFFGVRSSTSTLSADGRWLAFRTHEEDLVPGGNPAGFFRFDTRAIGFLEEAFHWVSDGPGTPSVSGDGMTIAYSDFGWYTEGPGIYVNDNPALASVGLNGALPNAPCDDAPQISGNARFVAFSCVATNLITGDTNGVEDVFVRDREAATTQRVSVGPGGLQANGASRVNSISEYGRYVVFSSKASNLVAGDTNGLEDVFVRDRVTGVTQRVSVGMMGAQANGASRQGYVSSGGRYVLFTSEASNLVVGDTNGATDVFLRDRVSGLTERLSVTATGAQADGASEGYGLSADGRKAVMISASALLPKDSNPDTDVYVLDRDDGTLALATVSSEGIQGKGFAMHAAISSDGRVVSFSTTASLHPIDQDGGATDLYVHELDRPAPPEPVSFKLSPISLEFGERPLLSETSLNMTVTNTGTDTLANVGVGVQGLGAEHFRTDDSACDEPLTAGSSCRVVVTFQPYTDRRVMGVIGAYAGGVAEFAIAIGTGVRDAPSYTLSPIALGFGTVAVGATSAGKYATIRNTGSAPLVINPIRIEGRNAQQFTYKSNCPLHLAAGAACGIRIVFKPTWQSSMIARLVVQPYGAATAKVVYLNGTSVR